MSVSLNCSRVDDIFAAVHGIDVTQICFDHMMRTPDVRPVVRQSSFDHAPARRPYCAAPDICSFIRKMSWNRSGVSARLKCAGFSWEVACEQL